MAARTKIQQQVNAFEIGVTNYEEEAKAVYDEAQYAAAIIPATEFEEVFQAAPEMDYHHRYVQSILTWVWYEINENKVALEHLPEVLQRFYVKYEEPFARYWA